MARPAIVPAVATRPPAPESRRTGRVTIRDVAERAGVSIAAVSRVLTDRGYSSAEMRERVQRAIDELGYRPLAAARALRGHARTIGVLLPDLRNMWYPDLVDAISSFAAGKGYRTLVVSACSPVAQGEFYEIMEDDQTAGMILLSPLLDGDLLEAVGARHPLVVQGYDGPTKAFDTVGIDEALACRCAVEHLMELGHERIAWISSTATVPPHGLMFRTAAFGEAMRHVGLEPIVESISAPDLLEGGHAGMLRLLDRRDPPTAIVAPTDLTALGASRALAERGLCVPGDVSILSFDNTLLAALPALSLTSIDQHASELGRSAARLLFERILDGRTRPVRVIAGTSLVERSSTGTCRRSAPASARGRRAPRT